MLKLATIKKMSKEEFLHFGSIGFCQPKFYKPSVWRKGKSIIELVLIPNGLAIPYDYGWGKGKYSTPSQHQDKSIDDLLNKAYELLHRESIAA